MVTGEREAMARPPGRKFSHHDSWVTFRQIGLFVGRHGLVVPPSRKEPPMNHALKAVVTLVFGAGLAVAAQAQGTNPQNGTPGGTTPNAQPTAPMPNTAPSA